jgi:DNA repair exonuclease SbcCD ATPase subunit
MPQSKLRKTHAHKTKGRRNGRGKMDPKNNAGGDGEIREGANVDKIRDILFGNQMRDYDKRFIRLEERLTKAAESLQEDLRKRFDSLESFVRQELESLNQRLKGEKAERAESLKEITHELRDAFKALEKRLSQLDEQLSDGHTELRAQILEQSKMLSGEIDKMRRETAAALDREVQVLRTDKTDRAALADLFSEVSLRLKNEFELPEE